MKWKKSYEKGESEGCGRKMWFLKMIKDGAYDTSYDDDCFWRANVSFFYGKRAYSNTKLLETLFQLKLA